MSDSQQLVRLRNFPFPYRACLSICSDIDYTDSLGKFKAIQSFMNEEIGIKFTNTFLPFDDKNKFSLFSNSPSDREIILKYIKEGAIDAIHSYGEKKDFTRVDAMKVLEELKHNNCFLKVWIDHAQSKSNFCKYRFFGRGDVPTAKEYHADLTKNYGIKFIWTERLTNIIGQDVPLNLTSLMYIYDRGYPFSSLLQIAKSLAKIILSWCNYKKYVFFRNNDLMKISTFKNNQKIYEFVRFNNYYKGVEDGDSFTELYYLISKKVLNQLKKVGGYSIVYVHLGKNFNLDTPLEEKTVIALKNLKREFEEGSIYVDSTSKILNYYIIHKYLNWSFKMNKDDCFIYINSADEPISGPYLPSLEQLESITFYVPPQVNIRIFNQDEELKNIRYNPCDYTGENSVTIIKS